MKYQKKSFSIQAYKIQIGYLCVCLCVCVFVQRTPPRRSILAICLISQCVGMVPTLSPLTQKQFFGMTERSAEGSKYKNGHISGITYGTRLGVVPMDRYLFGASHEKVSKI